MSTAPQRNSTVEKLEADKQATPACHRPIEASERIYSIDVLRGVAVLGILMMNIQSYAMPGAAYMNPTAYGDLTGLNYWCWYLAYLLGDLKFWSIFSMLFGAGIVISTARCDATGRSAASIHYRRMLWLLVFGLVHAHLIWYGDILVNYAICGMGAFFLRKFSARTLLVLGAVPLLVSFCISLGFGSLISSNADPELTNEMAGEWAPGAASIQTELRTYRGTWAEQQAHRSRTALFFETMLFLVWFGWRSMGLILIGMGLYKLDVFNARKTSRRVYATFVVLAALVGLPVVAWGIYQNEQHNWSLEYSFNYGPLYNFWGSIFVALGWVGLVMLICNSTPRTRLTRPFASAGRMALSCYLMQSIICTFIFYGHGCGLFGRFERWQQLLTVGAVWMLQLALATLWLAHFRYGPFEWLWRSLTYGRPQPMWQRAE